MSAHGPRSIFQVSNVAGGVLDLTREEGAGDHDRFGVEDCDGVGEVEASEEDACRGGYFDVSLLSLDGGTRSDEEEEFGSVESDEGCFFFYGWEFGLFVWGYGGGYGR